MDQKVISPVEVPDPLTLVKSADGTCIALMFFWQSEETDCRSVALEAGFSLQSESLGDKTPEDAALLERYLNGEAVLDDWTPVGPDGSTLVGKWDTEDGPVAYFATPIKNSKATEVEEKR